MHTTSAQAVQPHTIAQQQQQEYSMLVAQLQKHAQLIQLWSSTLPSKAKQMSASQEQAKQRLLKMHTGAQAYLSIVSTTARAQGQTSASSIPTGALEKLKQAKGWLQQVRPYLQRFIVERDQEKNRAKAKALALGNSSHVPTLATALRQVEVDTEAAVAALERALTGPTPPDETSNKSAEPPVATTAITDGLRRVDSGLTLTLTDEERTSALLELRAALKAAVDPNSLPPYCPARPVKRRRIVSDAHSECGTSCSISPFIFEGAVGQAQARGWEATISRVGSQIHCRIAAWVGKLPAFIITLPETFAQPPASQHVSEEAGGVCGSTLWAADDSGSEFASVVRWQFERPAVGVAAAVQSELKRRLSYSSHFSDRHKQRQATEALTITNAAQLVDALAIVGSSILAK
eukprot:COSAG02_NODE_1298_length_13386_cov_119.041921_2_plen_405_part_00